MADPSPHDELALATQRFMGAFELVFKTDWAYSRELLAGDMNYAVGATGTFLEPEAGFEQKNWGARVALLRAHQELLQAMAQRGLRPEAPEADPWFVYDWPKR